MEAFLFSDSLTSSSRSTNSDSDFKTDFIGTPQLPIKDGWNMEGVKYNMIDLAKTSIGPNKWNNFWNRNWIRCRFPLTCKFLLKKILFIYNVLQHGVW